MMAARKRSVGTALSRGRVFAAVGERLGPDKAFVITSGNHDHGLAAGWIDARLQSEPAGFLGLEQHFEAYGPLAHKLVEAARPARLDFAYPGLRLAVEYDGAWHAAPGGLARDRRRLNRLTAAGWRVVFVTADDLHRPEELVRRIATALTQ